MDLEDEIFIVEVILRKSIFYGRWYEIMLYINNRVNKRDFFYFFNYLFMKCGKKFINLVIIVVNWGKFKNVRFIVVKLYVGKLFWCIKKFLKIEDYDIVSIYY